MGAVSIPAERPAERPPIWRAASEPGIPPALDAAWDDSRERLARIGQLLEAADLHGVGCVALAGSVARMEASAWSDVDLLVFLEEGIDPHSPAARAHYERVWSALAPLELSRPKPDGIYARAAAPRELFDPPPGQVAEPFLPFGVRFQLLLEAQPVWGFAAFERHRAAVVERYARHYVAEEPTKEWTYLLNDLIRYFRALCLTYQWESLDAPASWRMRNTKARHSRLIAYAGLLLLLGECSRERSDKVGWLQARLGLTPFERIVSVYEQHADPGWRTLARCYATFLAALADPAFRTSLGDAGADPHHPLARERHAEYERLKSNSNELISELVRFILARRDAWSERFFHYLLF